MGASVLWRLGLGGGALLGIGVLAVLLLGGGAGAQPGGRTGGNGGFGRMEDPFVLVTAQVRPSVVAVGSYHRNDEPTARYFGSGFVLGKGRHVATNAHVVAAVKKKDRLGELRVFFPDDREVRGRAATLLAIDTFRDVAIVRFEGEPAPPLTLSGDELAPQGRAVGLMGYPVGLALGLRPAVHRGVVSAVTPAVLPLPKGAKLTPELAAVLRNPYDIYQLDIVAFPGNSGSALFDARDGRVLGIINKVLGSKTREHLISHPSGISYAVPARWISGLLGRVEAGERLAAQGGQVNWPIVVSPISLTR